MLDAAGCVGVPHDEIERITQVELGPRLHDASARPDTDTIQVRIVCDSLAARMVLTHRATTETRELSLAEIGDEAKARMLALSVVELVADQERRQALMAAPPPTVPPDRQVPPPSRNLSTYPALRLFAGGLLRALFAGRIQTAGLRLRSEVETSRVLSWALAGDYAQGSRSIARGTLTVREWALSPSLCLRHEWGRLRLLATLGLRASVSRASGEPNDRAVARGDAFRDLNGGAVAGWLADLELGRGALIWAALEGERDLHALQVRSEGSGAYRVGPWVVNAFLGVGVRP